MDMLASANGPRLVAADEIPEYPLGEVHLESHYFFMFHYDRWSRSRMHLKAPYDVQGLALNLYFLSQRECPTGTLPDDDVMLAKLLHLDLAAWRDYRDRAFGPLDGWVPCRCGSEIRLMHPMVTAVVENALKQRDEREAENTEKAITMRLSRLRDALGKLGVDRSVVADDILIDRIDKWLLQNCHGQRRQPVIARALQHAVNEGWIGETVNLRKSFR